MNHWQVMLIDGHSVKLVTLWAKSANSSMTLAERIYTLKAIDAEKVG